MKMELNENILKVNRTNYIFSNRAEAKKYLNILYNVWQKAKAGLPDGCIRDTSNKKFNDLMYKVHKAAYCTNNDLIIIRN